VLAVLTYYLVERPIRFGIRARRGKIYALIIGMCVVGAAGATVHVLDGFPGRSDFVKHAAMLEQFKLPEVTDEACLAYAGVKRGEIWCRYTDLGADETVAVIGDSHAQVAFWGIAKIGQEEGYNTVLLGDIIPSGEALLKKVDRYKILPERKRIIFDVLKKRKDIRKVFIFSLGMIYITGKRQHDMRSAWPGCDGVGYELFKNDLQSYVDTLREYGKEVFIVSTNPVLPASPGDYIKRPLQNKIKKFPDVYKKDIIKRQGKYIQLLSEINNATIIDTVGPLCPEGRCLVFTEDGWPMYRDNNHLSFIGSEFQAERILRPYLGRGKGE
jgi:hypothetical protein